MDVLGNSSAAVATLTAAITSLIMGFLTHRRATTAHKDELKVDHAKMIQQAYQEILDELRLELERRREAENLLRNRVAELETKLTQETVLRQQLEARINELIGEVEEVPEQRVQQHEKEQHHDQQ